MTRLPTKLRLRDTKRARSRARVHRCHHSARVWLHRQTRGQRMTASRRRRRRRRWNVGLEQHVRLERAPATRRELLELSGRHAERGRERHRLRRSPFAPLRPQSRCRCTRLPERQLPRGLCRAPACDDGVKNGEETSVDCGGPSCMRCASKTCNCASSPQLTALECDETTVRYSSVVHR